MFNDFARRLIRTTNAIVDQFVADISAMVGINKCARVLTVDYIDASIVSGDYFSAFLQRNNVASTSTFYFLLSAAPTHDILIDSIVPTFDLRNLGTGTMNYKTSMFFSESTDNTFNYAGGSTATSFGNSMNGYHINDQSFSKLSVGGTSSISGTGIPDFVTHYATYFLEDQGNNKNLSSSGSDFFSGAKKLIVKAGTTVLVVVETTGTATGTFNVATQVSFLERAVA